MSINKDSQKAPNLRFKGFTDDWEQRKLGELSTIVGGGTPSTSNPEYWDGDIDWYAPAEIGEQSYVNKSKKTITELGLKKSSARILPVGTVLFTSRAGIGNTAILAKEATTNQGFQSIVPDQNKLDSYFIFSRTNELKRYGEVTGAGSTFVEVSGKQMSKMPIMVPVLSEQQEIGTFLEQIDNTITLHQRKLDQLKQLKEALLQQMFPGKGETVPKLRFAGFEGDWEERKLGEASDVRDGTHASPKYINQGHPMVTSKNLTSSGLDMTDVSFLTDEDFNEINKRSKVSIGDILFGMIGTIGNPVIVDRTDFAIKNVALIKEKSYNPITNKWLLQYLKSPSFNQFIQKENAGGTQKFIALGIIRDMILKVPGLQEQQEIGTFLEQLDSTITLYQRKLDQLQNMKQVLLQNMFI